MFPHYSSSGIVIANVDDIKFVISSLATGGNVDSVPSAETCATPAPASCKWFCGKTIWQHPKLHVLLSLWLYMESKWVSQSICCRHEPEWSLLFITEEKPAKTHWLQVWEIHVMSMNCWTIRIENNRTKWCLLKGHWTKRRFSNTLWHYAMIITEAEERGDCKSNMLCFCKAFSSHGWTDMDETLNRNHLFTFGINRSFVNIHLWI